MDIDEFNKLVSAYIVSGQAEAEAKKLLDELRGRHQAAQEQYSRAMQWRSNLGHQLLRFLVPMDESLFG